MQGQLNNIISYLIWQWGRYHGESPARIMKLLQNILVVIHYNSRVCIYMYLYECNLCLVTIRIRRVSCSVMRCRLKFYTQSTVHEEQISTRDLSRIVRLRVIPKSFVILCSFVILIPPKEIHKKSLNNGIRTRKQFYLCLEELKLY